MSRHRTSLIPKLFSYWWENLQCSNYLLHQQFSIKLNSNHFFDTSIHDRRFLFERVLAKNYCQEWSNFETMREDESESSFVKNGNNKIRLFLDIQQFKPNEINVKIIKDVVIIEGNHENEDEHKMVSRSFVRKYMIPEQCDSERITSTLSSDGVLTITVPEKPETADEKEERVINIEHTGKPAVEDDADIKKSE